MDDTITQYRQCFNTQAGKRVFGHMLADLGFFDTDLGVEDLPRINYAHQLVKYLGIVDAKNIHLYVDKLFELPVKDVNNE